MQMDLFSLLVVPYITVMIHHQRLPPASPMARTIQSHRSRSKRGQLLKLLARSVPPRRREAVCPSKPRSASKTSKRKTSMSIPRRSSQNISYLPLSLRSCRERICGPRIRVINVLRLCQILSLQLPRRLAEQVPLIRSPQDPGPPLPNHMTRLRLISLHHSLQVNGPIARLTIQAIDMTTVAGMIFPPRAQTSNTFWAEVVFPAHIWQPPHQIYPARKAGQLMHRHLRDKMSPTLPHKTLLWNLPRGVH